MVSPSAKRRAVKLVIETGIGTTAEACRALGLARSSYYRDSTVSLKSRQMREQIVQLSQEHLRYGYRRVRALLRREGHEINAKRVQRVRRKEGPQERRKQRKLRRLGLSTAARQRATQANHVWSWDFVEDQTENGTRFRVLTLIDEHTRECVGGACGLVNPGPRGDHRRGGGDGPLVRPHSALGYQTPSEFAGRAIAPSGLRSGFALPPSRRGKRNRKPMAGLSL